MKWKICIGCLLLGGLSIGVWSLLYPERSVSAVDSLETIGAVTMDKLVRGLEERVGNADVLLERYRRVELSKRESLIALKTLQSDIDSQLRTMGKAAGADGVEIPPADSTQHAFLTQKSKELARAVSRAEKEYTEFRKFCEAKKLEIEMLKTNMSLLKTEALITKGGNSDDNRKIQALEEAVKSSCHRLEAEMSVRALEQQTEVRQ